MAATSPNYRLGIACLIASILLISTSDAIAKHLTTHIPVMQIALAQAICTMIVVLMLTRGRNLRRITQTSRMTLQLTRTSCHLLSGLLFFLGIKHLPLADVVAIIFIGPLLITVLAAVFLHEQVGLRRWTACVVGLLGALIVVRPGLEGPGLAGLGWPAMYPVASVTLFAVYVTCTRRLAPTESSATMLFYNGIGAFIAMTALSPMYWVPPSPAQWLGLLAVGVIASSSTLVAIRAYALAPASLLAPYAYVEIVSATIYGYAFFGDLPDHFTIAGAGVIVTSGLYVYHRETLAARA
jgi:drug/metabolite transporter (DMT)-like permease